MRRVIKFSTATYRMSPCTLAGLKGGRVEAMVDDVQSSTKGPGSDRKKIVRKTTYKAGVDLWEVAAYRNPLICPVDGPHC